MTMNLDPYTINEEPTELILDEKHPGLQDQAYINRRNEFFNLARHYRLQELGLPKIEYTPLEHALWHTISKELEQAHQKYACSIYLQGKKALGLQIDKIPDLNTLNHQLKKQHGIQLVPAEGLIPTRAFFHYLSNRYMPCTQYLRYHLQPQYTPEPDAVHDIIGHVSPLMNKEYVELIQLIGTGVRQATDEQLLAWQRVYWFTIEFGLLQEGDQLKAFGAGLLSSFGELEYCLSNKVDRRPLDMHAIIEQDYDTTCMQNILFVIPSVTKLKQAVKELITEFASMPK